MKRLMIILASVFLFTLQSKSTNIPLDSIKSTLLTFLKTVEPIYTLDEEIPDFTINDRKRGRIKEGKEGVFVFGSWVSGARTHFLLVGRNDFQILNMEEAIDLNVLKLLDFMEHENYSKDDIIFYLHDMIETYRFNEKTIDSFNGYIR